MIVKAGSIDVTTYFVLRTAADGTATTGATITSIDLQYCRSGASPSAKVDATALAAIDSAHGDNKAFEVDATDAPGLYRVDWPDAAFAVGVTEVILSVKLASSFTEHLRVELSPAVDIVAISGDTTAADNLELQYDTNGLTGDTFPVTQAQMTARTMPTADYFDAANDTVANVTTTASVTNAVATDASSRTASKATGFAVAGDAMALTAGERTTMSTTTRDAILDRVLATNHDIAGSVGEVLQDTLAIGSTIDTKTDAMPNDVQTQMEAAGSKLGDLYDNQANWLTATGFSTHDAAAVKTAIETDGAKLDHLWEMTEDDAGTRRLTANSLEQSPKTGLALASDGLASVIAWTTDITGSLSGSVGSVTGAVGSVAATVDASLTQIIGTTIAETSAGRAAANWDFFWDNGDAQTAKTVNDVGVAGSGLSAQQVWEYATRTLTSGGASGSGARTVTVTVDDGATALENATVRFTEGANTYTGSTNASGVIVFSLDDATYAVSISKAGYTFTPTTKIVNGTEADTYSMATVTITAPPNASTTTGTMTVYDEQGSVESGVTVTVQVIDGPGTAGIGYDSTEWAATSNGSGVVEFAGIILGARYKIWRGTSKPEAQTFTAPTTGTSFNLAEVIGRG